MAEQKRPEGEAVEPGAYTLRRIVSIVATAAVAAAIGLSLGYPQAAWGALAGAPVGVFNYYLMYSAAVRAKARGGEDKGFDVSLLMRSFLRMGISMAALLIALPMGVEFILGMLASILAELASYVGDVARFVLQRR